MQSNAKDLNEGLSNMSDPIAVGRSHFRVNWRLGPSLNETRLERFSSLSVMEQSRTTQADSTDLSMSTCSYLTTKLAKLKPIELSVINLVESSVMAAAKGKVEQALSKAKEAKTVLETLSGAMTKGKLLNITNESDIFPKDSSESQPMTTGIKLGELSLMVGANLAEQLKLNGLLEESLDVYMQICKSSKNSVINSSGKQMNNIRFGMNVGNVLFQLADYNRALKYYRITLDQISPTSWRNMRIKLMNNISIALIKLGSLNEAQTSLNFLLSDNIISGTDRPCNGNHHEFGLNLAVCNYLRDDRGSLIGTLKSMIKAQICLHYDRAVSMGAIDSKEMYHHSPVQITDSNEHLGDALASACQSQSASSVNVNNQSSQSTESPNQSNSNNNNDSRPIGWSVQEDRLGLMISRKHNQISRALMSTCNLIADLQSRAIPKYQVRLDSSTGQKSTSDICSQLLADSSVYQSLVDDLAINKLHHELVKQFTLPTAISRLRDIDGSIEHLRSVKHCNSGAASKDRSSSTAGPSSMVCTNLCLINFLLGKSDRAAHFGRLALQMDSSNAAAAINLGNCYSRSGSRQTDLAEKLYLSATASSSLEQRAKCNMALLYRRSSSDLPDLNSRARDMIKTYKGTTSTSHLNFIHQLQLGLTLIKLESKGEASSVLNRLIAEDPEQSPELLLLFSKLANEQIQQQSFEMLAHKKHPYCIPLIEHLVALSIATLDHRGAITLLLTAIRNQPYQVRWFQMLAECLWRKTDYKDAIAIYKSTLDVFPNNVACLKALIRMLDELGLSTEKVMYESRYQKITSLGIL